MDRSEGFRRRTTTDDAVMRAISEPLTLAIAAMQLFMATCAQRNQFGTFVGALLTAGDGLSSSAWSRRFGISSCPAP